MNLRPSDPISVVLADGKTYPVRLTMGSIRRFRTEIKSMQDGAASEQEAVESVTALLHVALQAGGNELSREQVADLMDLRDIEYYIAAVTEAMPTQARDAAEAARKNAEASQPDATLTGSSSGASPDTTSDSQTSTSGT